MWWSAHCMTMHANFEYFTFNKRLGTMWLLAKFQSFRSCNSLVNDSLLNRNIRYCMLETELFALLHHVETDSPKYCTAYACSKPFHVIYLFFEVDCSSDDCSAAWLLLSTIFMAWATRFMLYKLIFGIFWIILNHCTNPTSTIHFSNKTFKWTLSATLPLYTEQQYYKIFWQYRTDPLFPVMYSIFYIIKSKIIKRFSLRK